MVVTGVEIDGRIRAAKRALKGQRGGPNAEKAARELAELLLIRAVYETSVHARFHLNEVVQAPLAVALAYRKALRYTSNSLRDEINKARRVKLTLEDPCT
jgi:hypothetical protein